MIKFFRNIRQSLLKENKTSKYLKYAIGEIALVMIGILLALQVNNWNQSNKDKLTEQMYLKNILSDLRDQNTSIDVQIKFEQFYFNASNQIIKDFQHYHNLTIDSTFFRNASILTSRKTFVVTDPTYTDLISSGNINLIKNSKFKDQLIKYYQELKRIEKIIQNNNSLLIDQNYLSTFNKSGYYFEPEIHKIFGEINISSTSIATQVYETELQELSKKIISKDENKLAFMNALYLRNTVAIGHIKQMENIQSMTQSLITELEQLYND